MPDHFDGRGVSMRAARLLLQAAIFVVTAGLSWSQDALDRTVLPMSLIITVGKYN